jgi:hypothetical protein
MSFIDDTRRWLKDRLSAQDEYIDGTPREKIQTLKDALPGMSAAERVRNLEHVRAYTTNYHLSRHNEAVPRETVQELYQIQRTAEKLSAVDHARSVMDRYGGPPSLQTINDALERSQKERESQREAPREAVAEQQKKGQRLKV